MALNIILGTAQFGLKYGINNFLGKPGENIVHDILSFAHGSGIHTLDTADAYGNAQNIIGTFHLKNSARFDINTKFSRSEGDDLRSMVALTLKKLKVTQVHTYFYHSFSDYISNPSLLG